MAEIMRYHIIQWAIDKLKKNKQKVNYLEIGVQRGFCFFQIKADMKIAVDPAFVIDFEVKEEAYRMNPSNKNNVFFELTSNEFFDQQQEFLVHIGGLDVVLIDGLHLYEQVLLDVEHCLKYLNPNGVLILHDCNPMFKAGAIRGYSPIEIAKANPLGWNGTWHGDVWKAIVRLRSERPDLNVQVIDCDFGIGLVRKGFPENMLYFSPDEINALNYEDLELNRVKFLNLKSVDYLRTNLYLDELG